MVDHASATYFEFSRIWAVIFSLNINEKMLSSIHFLCFCSICMVWVGKALSLKAHNEVLIWKYKISVLISLLKLSHHMTEYHHSNITTFSEKWVEKILLAKQSLFYELWSNIIFACQSFFLIFRQQQITLIRKKNLEKKDSLLRSIGFKSSILGFLIWGN